MRRPLYNPWSRLRWPALLLLAIIVYGVVAYMVVQGWSLIESLYTTLGVLTTLGATAGPLETSGKLITITLMVLGVTLLLTTLSLVATAVAEGGLGEARRRRRMEKRIADLKDHHIICAYGRVGRTIGEELIAERASFVIVDTNEDLEEELMERGFVYIIGDATSEDILQAAGVERAKSLICAVDSDAANVYIALAARSLNPSIFIIARASQQSSMERLYRAGADRVVSPHLASGRQMALQALRPRVVDYFELGDRTRTGLRIEELEVGSGSELVGRALAEVTGSAIPLAVRHVDGELVANPDPSLQLRGGDLLVLMGERESLRPVEE
jgi:voltage-gated potassium channel